MSVRIVWTPGGDTDIVSYSLERSPAIDGTYAVIATIPHAIPGADYDSVTGSFFYVDQDGTLSHYYRLIAVDVSGQFSVPTAPTRAATAPSAITSTVKVDHDYGGPGVLRYQAANGTPVEAAVVRIFKKVDYDQQRRSNPIAVTTTDAYGNWVAPIFLTAGYAYVVHFHKEGLYGPDTTEVVV